MKTYKVGVIGFAHMHVLHILQEFVKVQERIEWVGCYDLTPDIPTKTEQTANRHQNVAMTLEQTKMPLLSSVEAVLDRQPDLVIVCSENAKHSMVCCAALLRGIHVLVEKPMAYTMQQAYAMARAAKHGNAKLIINWPSTWMPAIRTAERLLREGAIGTPFRFHYRNSSSMGPFSYGQTLTDLEKSVEWWHRETTGGGATMDYCCYGSCLARWFLGEDPMAAYGIRANFDHQFAAADDYGTITAQFPSAVAIIEGSWTTLHSGVPNGPIISGLAGTMVTEETQVLLYTKYHSDQPPIAIPADPLPLGRETIAKEVLHHLDTGEPLHPTLSMEVNLGAMKILDAGIRSSISHKMEQVGSVTYTIGE